jgi:hypothetical protein
MHVPERENCYNDLQFHYACIREGKQSTKTIFYNVHQSEHEKLL